MAYGATTSSASAGGGLEDIRNGRRRILKPLDKKTKTVKYSTDTPDMLLDLSSQTSVSVPFTSPIQAVKVKNEGYVPAIAIFTYSGYTTETAAASYHYIQYLLNPNDEIMLPTTRALIHDSIAEWDGTAVTATAPDSNEYVDSTANMDSATASGTVSSSSSTTLYLEPYTDEDNCVANMFHVGDLIRATNEIMEVTAIGNKTDLANNYITVRRGVHGSTAASDHSDADAILLPFFNAYHDFDKYSVAQTDSNGRFKAQNFFGYGRSASGQAGLVPGSIAIQFYTQGYHGLGMSGVTSSSETGLTASTEYGFDITVDGSGLLNSDTLKFTTSTSNTKWGGADGVLAKIQEVFDTQFYTTSSNLLNERVTVGIEGGDVVFRSGSYLSTSAILLAAPSEGETTPFGVGAIPAIGSVEGAVASRLEQEKVFNPITNGETYKQIFIRDDGNSNLMWRNERNVGKINYESGAINWTISDRPNAEFVCSVLHSSPFSGKLDPTVAGRRNSLRQILGNTPQQKCEAILTVTTY